MFKIPHKSLKMIKRRKKPSRSLFRRVFSNIYITKSLRCPGSVEAYLENQGSIIRPCQISYRTVGTRVRIPARAYGPVAQLGRALETLHTQNKCNVSEAFNQVVVGSNELFFETGRLKES